MEMFFRSFVVGALLLASIGGEASAQQLTIWCFADHQ
jgi:hypothetical protein